MRVVVKGGTIVNPTGCFNVDILIENGIITGLGKNFTADIEIDAKGCLVMPGLVDPHVHMGFKSGEFMSSDDFETGTRAAAYGGVTTIIDFAVPESEESLDTALVRRLQEAEGHCYVDYEIHVAITCVRDSLPIEIQKCIKQGVSTFRLYTVYPGLKLSEGDLYILMSLIKENGGLARIHAENASIIEIKQTDFLKKAAANAYSHYLSRPAFVEEEAISGLLILQRETGCPIYFNHVSTAAALQLIQQAKARGQQVYAEVCPQYLFLTAEVYQRPNGFLYLTSPAFKSEADRVALWKGIELGIVDTIGTDHCPYTKSQKAKYVYDFTRIPNGVPGVETTLPLLFTEWKKRGWPLEKLVTLISYNPSRIFGLFPRKGLIQPGADADIIIFDPNYEWEIHTNLLHMNVDWNPYEGFKCVGKVKTVLLRGQILIQDEMWKCEDKIGQKVIKNQHCKT